MGIFEAFILGIVQGLTEFLPVSSSGHLVFFKNLLGVADVPIFFDVMFHVGTLAAVCVVLLPEIIKILSHPIKNHLGMLVVATIPAALVGYLFNDFFESMFGGSALGICFLVTAVILALSEVIADKMRSRKRVTMKSAVVMGCMQAVAIFPGISRSGSTLAGGLLCGVDRKKAANFAFLMSIPMIIGSAVFEGKNVLETGMGDVSVAAVIVGTAASAVSGFFAAKWMLSLIQRKKLFGFAIYVAILGAFVIIDQNLTHLIF